jgi:hypothetical protein
MIVLLYKVKERAKDEKHTRNVQTKEPKDVRNF